MFLRRVMLISTFVGLAALIGCGGGSSPVPPANITVVVTPTAANVGLSQAIQFTANVTGSQNPSVVWAVNGVQGGNSQFGTINTAGSYSAPDDLPSSASVAVTATSVGDPSKSGTATAAIISNVSINIVSKPMTIALGHTFQFNAEIAGTNDKKTIWDLLGPGTISANGIFTAPDDMPASAVTTVTATAAADRSHHVSAQLQIGSGVMIAVAPAQVTVLAGGSTAINAVVAGSNDTRIKWSVNGIPGGDSKNGTVDVNGIYGAPVDAIAGQKVLVTATAAADASRSASSTVTIVPAGSTNRFDVLSTDPTTDETIPGTISRVRVTFNAPVDVGTINGGTIQVLRTSTGGSLPGVLDYDDVCLFHSCSRTGSK
jgi:hypothetical protein